MAALDYCPSLSGSAGVAVRFSLVWTCASALLVKKVTCEPDRPWKVFALDVSKQALGAYWAYALSAPARSCGDYWTSTLVETTLGVFVEYLALVFLTRLFSKASGNAQPFTTGEYYDAEGSMIPKSYFLQLVLWLLCVTWMKCVTIPVAWSYSQGAEERVLKAVSWNQHVEMIIVVLITPCLMRGLQVVITDDFLKKDGETCLLSEAMLKAFGKKRKKHSGGGSPKKGKKAGGKKRKADAAAASGAYVPPQAPTPEQLEAGRAAPPAEAAAVAAEAPAPPPPAPPAPVPIVEEKPAPAEKEAAPKQMVQFRSDDTVVEVPAEPDMRSSNSLTGRQAPSMLVSPCNEELAVPARIELDLLPWAEDMTVDKVQKYRADRGAPPASPEEVAASLDVSAAAVEARKKALRPIEEEQLAQAVLPPGALAQYQLERTNSPVV